jgi:hypothetical protein
MSGRRIAGARPRDKTDIRSFELSVRRNFAETVEAPVIPTISS